MSEASDIVHEQETRLAREPAMGPLLPRWFKMLFYGTFAPFCVFAVIWISHSLYVQHQLTSAANVVLGGLSENVSLDSPEGQQAVAALENRPLDGWLYLIQELLRDEIEDPRMARILALRKAIRWGEMSVRLDVIQQIVANMTDDGGIAGDFELTDQMRTVLRRMIEQRRADPEMSYVETRITDVLEWLADGYPGQPQGPEKRRMIALERQYEKSRFVGAEAEALEFLIQEWAASSDATARSCAEKFQVMLEGGKTSLTESESEYCQERIERWEDLYDAGITRVAEVGYSLLKRVIGSGERIDHPHIYQYMSLLGQPLDSVRKAIVEGVWLLRHNKFCLRFLGGYATRTQINPVMAVETERLTKEEHERIMRRINDRRVLESVRLLGRIGVDYVQNRAEYDLAVDNQDAYVRQFVVHSLESVEEHPTIGPDAESSLQQIRQADMARPGGPIFFGQEGEE